MKLLRRIYWRIIGRRYGPQHQVLCFRSWWLAQWEPVKVRKVALPWVYTEDVLDDLREQMRRDVDP